MRTQVSSTLFSIGISSLKPSVSVRLENKNEAIDLYRLGIEEFLMGLGVQLRGDSVEKGKHIQEKMESNLAMALERVEALSKHLTISIKACKGEISASSL